MCKQEPHKYLINFTSKQARQAGKAGRQANLDWLKKYTTGLAGSLSLAGLPVVGAW